METARCFLGAERDKYLNRGGNGHQNTHVRGCPDAMRNFDFANQDIAGIRRDRGVIGGQKFSGTFKNGDAQLAVDIMGMDRQFLACLEVEIQNFEIFRIVDQQGLEGDIAERAFVEEIDLFHPSSCAIVFRRRGWNVGNA